MEWYDKIQPQRERGANAVDVVKITSCGWQQESELSSATRSAGMWQARKMEVTLR